MGQRVMGSSAVQAGRTAAGVAKDVSTRSFKAGNTGQALNTLGSTDKAFGALAKISHGAGQMTARTSPRVIDPLAKVLGAAQRNPQGAADVIGGLGTASLLMPQPRPDPRQQQMELMKRKMMEAQMMQMQGSYASRLQPQMRQQYGMSQ